MKVRIKNVTGSTSNEWLLWELKKEAGVKEGDIVEGKFNPKNKAVDFTKGTSECVSVKPAKKLKNKLYNPGRV